MLWNAPTCLDVASNCQNLGRFRKLHQSLALKSVGHFGRIELVRLRSLILGGSDAFMQEIATTKAYITPVSSSNWDQLLVTNARVVTESSHCGNLRGRKSRILFPRMVFGPPKGDRGSKLRKKQSKASARKQVGCHSMVF